ncbi:MAG: pyridoxamine 5'-phosphate oxidase family protein [Geothrix sp.]|uniref:pyridoxamine 5'-phosphate oxidase family protein n=1 Tax=Geothrix sp. TaxID=1962974 RepID=UPI0017CEDD29|nr:pyridoxamine 5'-phosphate oxidase family protein [Geothrix sp.]NWJ41923.1 pyridoxamine 5'-phosphate oxidase family protein [Geothrix sp.]WIL20104.1 MAG: pyridoxamine 5'-phosphate oxidase family protein [Geothrix sp.]
MNLPSHPMRRRDRELSEAEALDLLRAAEWGVLATVDAEGWPYAVPVNHAVVDGDLVIHCATAGHKLDNLAFNPQVSYCAVTMAETLPLELATRYASVIVFGRADLVADGGEKHRLLQALGLRFAAEHPEVVAREVDKDLFRTAVLRIRILRATGKARL